jgi:hypothetical protein
MGREVARVDKDNMMAYRGCDFTGMNIEFIGIKERINGLPLEMFKDIETKSTFLRHEDETVMEAVERARTAYYTIP